MPLSSISRCSRLNSCPAFFSASFSSASVRSPQAPEEPELAVVDAEVDLAGHRRRPLEEAGAEQLAQRDRVVLARHGGDEAPVEVDRLELDLAHEVLGDRLGALDRLDVEGGHDLGEVGHVGLGEDRGRHHRLAEEPADLLFVGVAGGAPEALGELAGEAVGAAHAERHRAVLGIDPPDRLVGEVVALAVPADGRRPSPGLPACRSHRSSGVLTAGRMAHSQVRPVRPQEPP